MTFQVKDRQDLLELLRKHPKWREALRRELLGEDWIAIPELIRKLSQSQAELRAAMAKLDWGQKGG